MQIFLPICYLFSSWPIHTHLKYLLCEHDSIGLTLTASPPGTHTNSKERRKLVFTSHLNYLKSFLYLSQMEVWGNVSEIHKTSYKVPTMNQLLQRWLVSLCQLCILCITGTWNFNVFYFFVSCEYPSHFYIYCHHDHFCLLMVTQHWLRLKSGSSSWTIVCLYS